MLYVDGNIHLEMIDKPYQSALKRQRALRVLLCAAPRRDAVPYPRATEERLMGHTVPGSQCPGQDQTFPGCSAEVANLLSCFGQGPGQEALHEPHGWSCPIEVPLVTPGLFHFRKGSRNAPGYPLHQKGCVNNCPVCVYHSLDNFSGNEKTNSPEGV